MNLWRLNCVGISELWKSPKSSAKTFWKDQYVMGSLILRRYYIGAPLIYHNFVITKCWCTSQGYANLLSVSAHNAKSQSVCLCYRSFSSFALVKLSLHSDTVTHYCIKIMLLHYQHQMSSSSVIRALPLFKAYWFSMGVCQFVEIMKCAVRNLKPSSQYK